MMAVMYLYIALSSSDPLSFKKPVDLVRLELLEVLDDFDFLHSVKSSLEIFF